MSVVVSCESFPLAKDEVDSLWREVVEVGGCEEEVVAVACVDESRMREMNKTYRNKDKVSEVLTFSYEEGEHDVVLCREEIERQSSELGLSFRERFVWVLVHAFLHVSGMDHEKSEQEADEYEVKERDIIKKFNSKF
jgi:probable rRNA maturation factor